MSTTESSEEDGLSRAGRKRVTSGDRSLSSRVNRLTSALQDTNRNLRAVDKMLENYRDVGEQKAAVVDMLKEDLRRSETRQLPDSTFRSTVRRSDSFCDGDHHNRLSTSGELGNRLASPGRRRLHSSERFVTSDRESVTSLPTRGNAASLAVRFFDDMDLGDRHVHTLHQSIRDLSSEQLRLQQELQHERAQRQRHELGSRRTVASVSSGVTGITDIKQLESLQSELRAERQLWRNKHDDLCKISAELKQALLDRRPNITQSAVHGTERPFPFCNTLVIGDGDRQNWKTMQLTEPRQVFHAQPSNNADFKDNDVMRSGTMLSAHVQELSSKELQLSRATRQLEELQHVSDLSRQQMQDSISDLQRQLRETKTRFDSLEGEKEALRCELESTKRKNEEAKKSVQDSVQQYKAKNKRLEKELETCERSMKMAESKITQYERELETFRTQSGSISQQFELLKRQFNDLLGVRVQLDEQVRAKDCELNQLKSVRLDLDKDLRDCRSMIERLENELRSAKERIYVVTEEKNRVEDQLSALQSSTFTSDHQLHSLQKELQDASVNTSHMSVQMAKLAAENQELKMKVQEHQKLTYSDREEINSLRQRLMQIAGQENWQTELQNQQMQGKGPKSTQALIRRLKTDHAECYAELQTVMVALEEERALSSRHKNQVDILQLDIDQLHQQLAACHEEMAATQQQYYKLRHELLNNTTKQWSFIETGILDK